jgi:CheY-like chemotaxis protein
MIEDDDVDAKGMERSFKKRRIANPIIRAHDGQEGLELLEQGEIPSPFIILLDLQMPRMNGLEFMAALRKHDKLKSSVVFVLTTSQAEEDITAAFDQQIAGYFVKDEVGANFCEMLDMLEGYWRIAYLPQ